MAMACTKNSVITSSTRNKNFIHPHTKKISSVQNHLRHYHQEAIAITARSKLKNLYHVYLIYIIAQTDNYILYSHQELVLREKKQIGRSNANSSNTRFVLSRDWSIKEQIKNGQGQLGQKNVTFKVHVNAILSAPRLALPHDDGGHDLLAEIGLALLHGGHDHVADAGRGEAIKPTLNALHRYNVEILGSGVIGAVYGRRHRETQRHPELVSGRTSAP